MSTQDITEEELVQMATEGVDPETIAAELQLSLPSVYRIMGKHGILAQRRAERNAAIIEDYKRNEITTMEILDKYGISNFTLYYILRQNNVPRRETQPNPQREATVAKVIQLYTETDMTVAEIEREVGKSSTFIYRVLAQHNVPRRTRTHRWVVVPSDTPGPATKQ